MNEKVYAWITADASDVIPDGQIGDWFDQFVYDERHDEYLVQHPSGEVRRYVGMTFGSAYARILDAASV